MASSFSNRSLVCPLLREIYLAGHITKPQAAQRLGVTAVTTHHLINHLLEQGILSQQGSTGNGPGRRAVCYSIRGEYGFLVSLDIHEGGFCIRAYSLSYKRLSEKRFALDMTYSSQTLEKIAAEACKTIQHHNIVHGRCLGLGVSLPGTTDHTTGVIYHLPRLAGWDYLPLKALLEQQTGVSVFLDNDANAMILAKKWRKELQGHRDAVYLSITQGIGAGVLCDGHLAYGRHSNFGEIGHTTLQPNGPLCTCGNRGCVDAMASDTALLREISERTGPTQHADIHQAVSFAQETAAGRDVLQFICQNIILCIDNIIKMYDPGIVFIGSTWLGDFPSLFDQIQEKVFAHAHWIRRNELQLILSNVSEFRYCSGCAVALENLFSDESSVFSSL